MLMHQEHQGPGLLLVEAQPRRRVFGQLPAHFTVVSLLPLAQVVQQHRQMEQILPGNLAIDLPEDARILPAGFCLGHSQQAVLIHSVLVVLIELHQPAHRPEDRHDFFQQMRPVHGFQRSGRPGAGEDIQEETAHLGSPEGFFRHRFDMPMNVFEERRDDGHVIAPCNVEQPYQLSRGFQDGGAILFRDGQRGPSKDKVFFDSRCGEDAPEPPPDRHAPTTLHKPHGALVESHRMPVVLLHELFDRQQMRAIGETESGGQPDLLLKRQYLLRGAGVKMHEGANPPEKFSGFLQCEEIFVRNEAAIREFLDRARPVPRHAGPLQQVQISKPPLALLHVGFEEIDGLSELVILPPALFQLVVQKAIDAPGHHFAHIAVVKLLEQLGAPRQKPSFHHRGTHGEIRGRQLKAIGDGADAVADLKSEIPKRMEGESYKILDHRPCVRPEQEHEVDVGKGSLLAASVAAQRH